MTTLEFLLDRKLLKKQRMSLNKIICSLDPKSAEYEHLVGLENMLDDVQDQADDAAKGEANA
jgi:hypothetical protein